MKILLTGADGQLGRCFAEIAGQGLLPAGWTLLDLSRAQLDITDAEAVTGLFRRLGPDVVINAAAWTDVDGAQHDTGRAMAVNALGAANVAAAATAHNARLVQISTDYVFSGDASHPIVETADPHPVNVYGDSKLAGEIAVLSEAPDAFVVRTSWLYSRHGSNFVKTILRHGARKPVLDVVDDQTGCPTCANDLAGAILQLVQRADLRPGIYHYSGQDAMTWFDFACRIVQAAGRHDAAWANVRVRRSATASQGRPAPRPGYSVLSCEKIRAADIPLYGLRDRLDTLVPRLLSS